MMSSTLLSLALSRALHKLEAHETSLGRVLSIVFLADSIDEDDSIEEAINALGDIHILRKHICGQFFFTFLDIFRYFLALFHNLFTTFFGIFGHFWVYL